MTKIRDKNITELLPHRKPFLFVDKITSADDTKVVALKKFHNNEDYFKGHFPGKPIVPGVLIIESMAQTAGIMASHTSSGNKKIGCPDIFYLARITDMKFKAGIVFFGITEILIGCITLAAVSLSLFQGKSTKPLEVLIFVIITSLVSFGLGIGILKHNLQSYHLLLFFATVIILSKILIFAKIMHLSGELETVIPADVKNIISIFYHGILIY